MRDYATVLTRMYTGRTMKALRGDPLGQLLLLYLITNPHTNMIGCYHLPVMYIAEDLGCPLEGAREALARVIAQGFCQYDCDLGWVFIPRMAEIQVSARLKSGDKRCAAVAREIERIESPAMKAAFTRSYAEAFAPAFSFLHSGSPERGLEAPSQPLRSQEQEHEHEKDHVQDQEQSQTTRRVRPGGADAPGDQRERCTGDVMHTRGKLAVARIEMADRDLVLPDWLAPHSEAWAAFEQIRWKKNSKAPYTRAAQAGILRELKGFHDEGQDIAAILNASVTNGWAGVFAQRGFKRPPTRSFSGSNYSGGDLERDIPLQ